MAGPHEKKVSMGFPVTALIAYAVMVLGFFWMLPKVPPEIQPGALALAAPMLGGGFLKVLNICQNYLTDKKVTEDMKVNRETKALINGGLDKRVAEAVANALKERDEAALIVALAAQRAKSEIAHAATTAKAQLAVAVVDAKDTIADAAAKAERGNP